MYIDLYTHTLTHVCNNVCVPCMQQQRSDRQLRDTT